MPYLVATFASGDANSSNGQSPPQEFETEARLLLAVKLYEMDRVSTGVAARLAAMSRVAFMFELARFGLSPMGQEPDELAEDLANA